MTRPNFFIVGAPKCGTTAMNDFLAQHPDIFMGYKEMHYFGADLPMASTLTGERISLETYLDAFKKWNGEKRIGETAVLYLYSASAPQEIKAFDPQAKIVIMLRNPVEQMYSMYFQALFVGDEDLPTFEAALEAEPDRLAGKRIPPTCFKPLILLYRRNARYSGYVRNYFDTFGRENVHVIIHDEFKKDNRGVYRQLLEFLEVDPTFEPQFNVINPHKEVRSRRVMSLVRKPPRVLMPAKRAMWTLFPDLSVKLYAKVNSLNAVKKSRPTIDPGLRRQLQEEFRPEVEALSELLGKDLTHWVQA